jgi:hypothetical protein
MIKKPHIRLVDARLIFPSSQAEGHLWCLYSSRKSRHPIAMSRDRDKVYKKAKQRTDASRRALVAHELRMRGEWDNGEGHPSGKW